jgi:hypothetical protein
MNATAEWGHWSRRATYLQYEADEARRFGDVETARIFDDGAKRARQLADEWRRRIIGAK